MSPSDNSNQFNTLVSELLVCHFAYIPIVQHYEFQGSDFDAFYCLILLDYNINT